MLVPQKKYGINIPNYREVYTQCRQLAKMDLTDDEKLRSVIKSIVTVHNHYITLDILPKPPFYSTGISNEAQIMLGGNVVTLTYNLRKALSSWLEISMFDMRHLRWNKTPVSYIYLHTDAVNNTPLEEGSNYFEQLCTHLGVEKNKDLFRDWLIQKYKDYSWINLYVANTNPIKKVRELVKWFEGDNTNTFINIQKPNTRVEKYLGRHGVTLSVVKKRKYKSEIVIKNCEPPPFSVYKVIRELKGMDVRRGSYSILFDDSYIRLDPRPI